MSLAAKHDIFVLLFAVLNSVMFVAMGFEVQSPLYFRCPMQSARVMMHLALKDRCRISG
jgi:hypothetical protein